MWQLSCADFTFPLLKHEHVLHLIRMMEFDLVDIGLFEQRSHLQPSSEFAATQKNGLALMQKAAQAGLKIADIFVQAALDFAETAINHPSSIVRNAQRELFKRSVDYTCASGCDHLTGLPGVRFNDDSWRICQEELSWRAAYAKEHGLIYAVEAHIGSIIEDPDLTIMMMEETDGVTLTLDHSHFTVRGIAAEMLKPLISHASHLHTRGARINEMQCSVARNETNFQEIVSQLVEHDYSRNICIEYTYTDWEDCNRTDNVSETILLRNDLREHLSALVKS